MVNFELLADELLKKYLLLSDSIYVLKYVSSRKRDHVELLLSEMLELVKEMGADY